VSLWLTLLLLAKDAGIAAGVARETNTPARLLDLTSDLFHEARGALGEAVDHVEAVRYVERLAGVVRD
jgi:3-hydroxyisobutyrate dehydrogenase-like beta-hydroxyacid dehydrogenase